MYGSGEYQVLQLGFGRVVTTIACRLIGRCRDADFSPEERCLKRQVQTVWRHIVEARKWPEWYPNSHDVRIVNDRTGILQRDSGFEWSTFGIHIDSTVHEFVPNSGVGWFGKGTGIDAYHTWFLVAASRGYQVITEEVAKGPGAIAIRTSDPNGMHKGHELWLNSLKLLSEK